MAEKKKKKNSKYLKGIASFVSKASKTPTTAMSFQLTAVLVSLLTTCSPRKTHRPLLDRKSLSDKRCDFSVSYIKSPLHWVSKFYEAPVSFMKLTAQ